MMKVGIRPIGLALCMVLTGCMGPQPDVSDLPQRISPFAGGLMIADSGGQEISFGRSQLGVEVAVNRLVGAAFTDEGINAQGCVIRSWKNGLKLVFAKGHFVGWIAGAPVWLSPTTAGNTCGL